MYNSDHNSSSRKKSPAQRRVLGSRCWRSACHQQPVLGNYIICTSENCNRLSCNFSKLVCPIYVSRVLPRRVNNSTLTASPFFHPLMGTLLHNMSSCHMGTGFKSWLKHPWLTCRYNNYHHCLFVSLQFPTGFYLVVVEMTNPTTDNLYSHLLLRIIYTTQLRV